MYPIAAATQDDDGDVVTRKIELKKGFRSTVTKTSNCFSASVSKSPFLIPAHPICGTVLTSCPAMSRASRRSIHSSRGTFTRRRPPCDPWPLLKRRQPVPVGPLETRRKIIDGVAALKVVNQSLDRHTGPGKYGRSAHDIRRACYDRLLHRRKGTPIEVARSRGELRGESNRKKQRRAEEYKSADG